MLKGPWGGSCKGAQEENVNKPLIFHLVAKNVNQLILFQLVAVVGWAGPGLVVLPYAIFRKAPNLSPQNPIFSFLATLVVLDPTPIIKSSSQ